MVFLCGNKFHANIFKEHGILSLLLRETVKTKKPLFFLKYSAVILEVCFFVHLSLSLIGWNHNLDDIHGFRQCQTAISSYYTIKDGFKLNYETPILGKPWAIPMEFPLYQWLVALIVLVFHGPLDQTGRFLSLLFFYLTLFPAYYVLEYFTKDKDERRILISLVLLSPTYLFWSRTFMIESCALFWSMLFLFAVARSLETRKWTYYTIAVIAGSLAGLVKITTFAAFCFPCLAVLVFLGVANKQSWRGLIITPSYFIRWVALFTIPLTATFAWTHYADIQKTLNPMAADYLTSGSNWAFDWLFGTMKQKLSSSTWQQIMRRSDSINCLGKFSFRGISIPVFSCGDSCRVDSYPSQEN